MRQLRRRLFCFAAVSAFVGSALGAETITAARYAVPVERYGHFALGRPHEYAQLIVTTGSGRRVVLELPQDEVFEDLAPRLVKLEPDETLEILTIVSHREKGSRLVLIRLNAGGLAISAQSPATGTANRWLNPVGVADLDGDGRAEIAAVITPHIGGPLKVYQRRGGDLVEFAALAGFSNHVFGTAELALSAAMPVDGRMRLLVPDTTRMYLRIIAFQNGRLVEAGRCALSAPVTGAIRQLSPGEVSAGVLTGRQRIVLRDCLR